MKEVLILSSKGYEDAETKNYGDCVLLNTGASIIIYDCGSEKHAERAIDYMNKNGFDKAVVILSHNDSDHFDGLLRLINEGRVAEIRTICLLKYLDKILECINDDRRNRESLKNEIKRQYDNIATLSGCNLVDIYENDKLIDGVRIVGPDFDYMVNAVAKQLDSREGDSIDHETVYNATSVQVSIDLFGHKVLLTGDASFEAIEDKIRDYDIIQLPHHGKSDQADKIFQTKYNQVETLYIVSDNTGNSNGGSDKLETKGHRVFITKEKGDVRIDKEFLDRETPHTGKNLCNI